mmetsp:Transcript_34203/g.82673  ORF Transcript_34203/g.82673 Transcript_34203/m.82673 type:complete len:282 (-) Transcript_34203:231-1076(-)
MSLSSVRIRPDDQYKAEVVVFLTTLSANAQEFSGSKRAQDLLEIKRVHFKRVDFNSDASAAQGPDEQRLVTQFADKVMLQRRSLVSSDIKSRRAVLPSQIKKQKGAIRKARTAIVQESFLPSVFVDGVNIGDASDLQSLEDDGRLDRFLRREACPSCGTTRQAGATTRQTPSKQLGFCTPCGQRFQVFLPDSQTFEKAVELAQQWQKQQVTAEYEQRRRASLMKGLPPPGPPVLEEPEPVAPPAGAVQEEEEEPQKPPPPEPVQPAPDPVPAKKKSCCAVS